MTTPIWRVVVARELDDGALAALARAGANYISGHGGPGYASSSVLVRAPDEEAARKAIERALGEHAFIREARAMSVFVHAPIPPEARAAFEQAAAEDNRVGGVVEDEKSGALETYFELPHGNVDSIFNEALGIYSRITEAGGLTVPGDVEFTMSGFESLLTQASRDRQLLDRANEFMDQDERELAVVLAQTACEVVVADALRNLLLPHVSDELRPWLLARVRSFTLADDPTRDLWNRITSSVIQDEDFWVAYLEHVRRRHRVVHAGARVDPDAARSSLTAAAALFDYVERAVGNAPPPAAPP